MNSAFEHVVAMGLKVVSTTIKAQAPAIRNAAIATVGKLAGEMIRESVPKGSWAESARIFIDAVAGATKTDVVFPREVRVANGEEVK